MTAVKGAVDIRGGGCLNSGARLKRGGQKRSFILQ